MTAQLCTEDEALHQRVVNETMRQLLAVQLDGSPPGEYSCIAYRTAERVLGIADPYYEQKRKYNHIALGLYPQLKQRVEQASDPLYMAAKLAIAGNIIDLGIGLQFDLMGAIEQAAAHDPVINHFPAFRRQLESAQSILYLSDNAGEIVFDRLFVEELPRGRVTFVVKSGPIINDALREDAEEAGVTHVAKVITTGSNKIGVPWGEVSHEFLEAFHAADIILSKGMGNFETTATADGNIFFLLKAKCSEVAPELGVKEGDVVFMDADALRRARTVRKR
jgi:uncharacterized protein with ATP-grasp and redox domains